MAGSGDFAGKTAVRGFGDRSEFNESPAELGNTVSRTGEAGDRYPRHGDVGDSVRVLCGHLVEGPLVQSAHRKRVFIWSGIDEERRQRDVKNLLICLWCGRALGAGVARNCRAEVK